MRSCYLIGSAQKVHNLRQGARSSETEPDGSGQGGEGLR